MKTFDRDDDTDDTDDTDEALRRVFAELRDTERSGVPPFDATLRAPRHARRAIAPRVTFAMAAVAAVAAMAAVIAAVVVLRRPSEPRDTLSLLAWRAPTDVLLRVPGAELFQSVPSLRSSVLDGLDLP